MFVAERSSLSTTSPFELGRFPTSLAAANGLARFVTVFARLALVPGDILPKFQT